MRLSNTIPITNNRSRTHFFTRTNSTRFRQVTRAISTRLTNLHRHLLHLHRRIEHNTHHIVHNGRNTTRQMDNPNTTRHTLVNQRHRSFIRVLNNRPIIAIIRNSNTNRMRALLNKRAHTLLFRLTNVNRDTRLLRRHLLFNTRANLFDLITQLNIRQNFIMSMIQHNVNNNSIFRSNSNITRTTSFRNRITFQRLQRQLTAIVRRTRQRIQPTNRHNSRQRARTRTRRVAQPIANGRTGLLSRCIHDIPGQ